MGADEHETDPVDLDDALRRFLPAVTRALGSPAVRKALGTHDEVRQTARVVLWRAHRDWDPALSPFGAWVRLKARRAAQDVLRATGGLDEADRREARAGLEEPASLRAARAIERATALDGLDGLEGLAAPGDLAADHAESDTDRRRTDRLRLALLWAVQALDDGHRRRYGAGAAPALRLVARQTLRQAAPDPPCEARLVRDAARAGIGLDTYDALRADLRAAVARYLRAFPDDD